MSSVHETAYPRFKPDLTDRELQEIYTPSRKEIEFIQQQCRQPMQRLAMLTLLKTFQRLGYFVTLAEVPERIQIHIAKSTGLRRGPKKQWVQLDKSGARQRFLNALRAYLDIKAFTRKAETMVFQLAESAAETKQELADIINVVIEELVHQRYELPGFHTLFRAAQAGRNTINTRYFESIYNALTASDKADLDALTAGGNSMTTGWQQLKREPKKPTNREVRHYLQHIEWLQSWIKQIPAIDHVPAPKRRQYMLEARSLDAAELRKVKPVKRYALIVVLIHAQLHKALDDCVGIFLRKLHNLHTKAEEQLQQYHLEHARQVDKLVGQLHDVLQAYQDGATDRERLAGITASLRADPETLLSECEAHMAYAGNNYYPFMLGPYQSQRPLLLNCLALMNVKSTTRDQSLIKAVEFVLTHRNSHKETVPILAEGAHKSDISLHWLPEKWRKLVTGKSSSHAVIIEVHRKHFELCVLTQVMRELKSGDLFVEHSEQYGDYREQLLDWETYDAQIVDYSAMLNLPAEPSAFVSHLHRWLSEVAQKTDRQYPDNEYLDVSSQGLIIRKHAKNEKSPALVRIDAALGRSLTPNNILDILVEAESWLNLHRLFKPISGFETKLDEPRKRFITTLFCYGCNLGPTQTARSVKGLSRKQVAWLNLRHVTEERLEKAIVRVINAYNKFLLPKYWGSGKHASADGTKWNLYEQNLLSEYHIRYGGYGGIGYYHVSDMYIALFSHFIPCGVYEAIYILDGLIKNESDIQPDTVHGDTQAQSAPVFGLAYLLGINLMPRIRNIKKLMFFKPDKTVRYEHINKLFNESINWQLIETHLPDMLRIALSIKAGKITPSTILRRLGTYSRKNKLYFAFRELGRVVRTVFLLEYIGDVELRKTIQSATNKSEEFNNFTKWLFFGGEGIIAENVRHEQRKIIKYNQLVANLVILHNVEAMTRVLRALQTEGEPIDEDVLGGLSPYRTEHINRFGDYVLDLDREIRPVDFRIRILD